MSQAVPKLVAACLGASLVAVGAFAELDPPPGVGLFLLLIAGVLFVWFPSQIGSYTGSVFQMGHSVDRQTPGCVIAFVGWLLLVVVPLYYYFVARHIGQA
jgi:hypothetical protein